MKFIVDLVSKHSGRIGHLTKADFEVKTPHVLHYTKERPCLFYCYNMNHLTLFKQYY